MKTLPARRREVYRDELDSLLDSLLDMSRFVASAVGAATSALLEADLPTAERVVLADVELDDARCEREQQLFALLARQAPVAGDLRMVVASLRMVTELERMGDLAVHIAKIARLRHPASAVPEPVRPNIAAMAEVTQQIVMGCCDLLVTKDLADARAVQARDAVIDGLRRAQFRLLLGDSWTFGVESAVDVALLGRYYERIADHAVSMSRRIAYIVTG